MFGKKYSSCSSQLRVFSTSLLSRFFLAPSPSLNTIFSNTPQHIFLPQGQRPSFTLKTTGTIIVLYIFIFNYDHGVDSASNKNGYQEYFLGGKCGRSLGLTTLPFSCANCLEIYNPEPPRTIKDCSDRSRDCFTGVLISP